MKLIINAKKKLIIKTGIESFISSTISYMELIFNLFMTAELSWSLLGIHNLLAKDLEGWIFKSEQF